MYSALSGFVSGGQLLRELNQLDAIAIRVTTKQRLAAGSTAREIDTCLFKPPCKFIDVINNQRDMPVASDMSRPPVRRVGIRHLKQVNLLAVNLQPRSRESRFTALNDSDPE
jgi:hypothetical protein